MWEQMTLGVAGMWSNPYMLIFWLFVLIGAVVLGVVIGRTLHERHDDTHTLPRH